MILWRWLARILVPNAALHSSLRNQSPAGDWPAVDETGPDGSLGLGIKRAHPPEARNNFALFAETWNTEVKKTVLDTESAPRCLP